MIGSPQKPLSDLQKELLKIYSFGISDDQLKEIKELLSQYFADQLTQEASRLWDENQWTEETMNQWLTGE